MEAGELKVLFKQVRAMKSCPSCGCDKFTILSLDLCPLGYPCSQGDWQTCAVTCNRCGAIWRFNLEVLKRGGEHEARTT